MTPFVCASGSAVPLLEDDINTDQIAPVQEARSLNPDYRLLLFKRHARSADGVDNPDWVLNKPQFRDRAILVAGRNFGCGSSREAAVWAMQANGITCIIARSFADIYRENCLQNGVLPVVLAPDQQRAFEQRVLAVDGAQPFTVDLRTQTITGPGGPDLWFDIPASDRMRLLEGLDDIGLTLKHAGDIAAWEIRMAAAEPWLQKAEDSRSPGTQGQTT